MAQNEGFLDLLKRSQGLCWPLADRGLSLSMSGKPLHCSVPGATMSSSMSSMSSDKKCWGVLRPPMKLGSKLRAEAREGRPGLFTSVKPVKISICCQRWSLSLRAAVTSPRACLERKRYKIKRHKYQGYYSNYYNYLYIFY